MDTKKFVRKPLYIDAVQVTDDNIDEVSTWCDGEIHNEPKGKYIKVKVQNPLTQRQTKAFVGDWVLSSPRGFKVYTDSGLKNSFKETEEEETTGDWTDPDRVAITTYDTPPTTINVFQQPSDAPEELLNVAPQDAIDGKQ